MSKRGQAIALGVLAVVVAGVVVASYINYQAKIEAAQGQPGTTPPVAQPVEHRQPEAQLEPLPANPSVVFLGDSWTMGYSAAPGKGYAQDVSATLGWHSRVIAGGGGTGYLNRGPDDLGTYAERLKPESKDLTVDLLVIQGGLNDAAMPNPDTSAFNRAVEATIRLGENTYPNAQVLVVGPLDPIAVPPSPVLAGLDDRLAFSTDRLGVPYVSPTREGWFASDSDVRRYIDSETGHPSTVGHAYYARRLAADVRG